MKKPGRWQTQSSKKVFDTPFLSIYSDEVIMPNGNPGHYGWMKSKTEAVYVVPLNERLETILIEQGRYTIDGKTSLECVAGGVNSDETHEQAGRRELEEEAGLKAKRFTPLIKNASLIYPSISKSWDPYKVFLAEELQTTGTELDQEEGITRTVTVPIKEARDMILSGDIFCSQSIVSLLLTITYLEKGGRL